MAFRGEGGFAPKPKPKAPSTGGDGSTYLAPAGTNGMGKEPRLNERPKARTSRPAGKASDTVNEYKKQVSTLEHSTAMY
jgi:hypothetical protein